MFRWLIVVFIVLILLNGLAPFLDKLGYGKLPGDFRFRLFGRQFYLPLPPRCWSAWWRPCLCGCCEPQGRPQGEQHRGAQRRGFFVSLGKPSAHVLLLG